MVAIIVESFFTLLSNNLTQQNSQNDLKLPLSWPRINEYMLRSPNTFRKYHDAELTLDDKCREREREQMKRRLHILRLIQYISTDLFFYQFTRRHPVRAALFLAAAWA